MTEVNKNNGIPEKTAIALGLFDGLHHGHRSVIAETLSSNNPSVFTFRTESVSIKQNRKLEYIYTNEHKLELMKKIGVRYVYSPDFEEVKNLNGEEFVKNILCGVMNAELVVCGENFRFGKNASCGVSDLERFGRKYGFRVVIKTLDGFSSEKYRELLREGKVSELCKYNDLYQLYTDVRQGNRIGRTLDFPTINQHFAQGQLVPKRGVYHTRTFIDGKFYPSVTNVGVKPTVEKDINPLAETHILGFSGDLYGKRVIVEFCRYIRDEKKFDSLEELKKQIFLDINAVSEVV